MTDNSSNKYEELFNEEPTYECSREKIDKKYIDKDYFKTTLKSFDNIIVKSPMGSGKSFTLSHIFKESTKKSSFINKKIGFDEILIDDFKYKSILYFSCKRAFASSMSKDFEEYGFKNYMDINGDFTKYDRIICSVESIQKCRNFYDLVIIDESESIADNLTGKMFIKNKCIEGATKMYDIIKNSKKIMLMDAYITTRSHNMLKEIKGNLNKNNTMYLQNNYMNEKRTFIDCDKTMLFHNLKKELLIYTPTITAGISYDPKNKKGEKDLSKHFDNLFIYAVNVGSSHFRDTIQAHRRIRDFKSKLLYICINDKYKGHHLDQLPTRKSEVMDMEEKYKSKLFGEECISLNDRENLKWIYNIHIHNILERNISQICMRGFATEYLRRENVIKKCENNTEYTLQMDDEHWDFDKIKSISSTLYEEYRDRMKSQEVEDNLDDEEFKQWYKFKYSHLLCKDINIPMKEYFNKYCVKPQTRGFINSIVEYKRMVDEIGCDYSRIRLYSQKKYQDDNIPMEYYDMKYKRYQHIMKIMNGVKLFENGVMNINKDIYGDDFKILCEEYSKIPIKTLNSMLTKNYITTKKKEECSLIKPRTLQGIFNQLIREEFGIEIHGNGKYKYIIVDGKKKKLTILKIRNAEVDDDNENELKFYNSEYLIFNMMKDKFEFEEIPAIDGEDSETPIDLSTDDEEGDCCLLDEDDELF